VVLVNVLDLLKQEEDPEVVFRSLISLGTFMFADQGAKELFAGLDGVDTIQRFTTSSDNKIATAAKAVLDLNKR